MDNSELLNHSKTWDRTGVIVASLCLLHCLAFPFLVATLPVLDFLTENPLVEPGLLLAGVMVGSISFYTSYRKHKKILPLLVGACGVVLLFLNMFLIEEEGHHAHHEALGLLETIEPMMVAGAVLLIIGHLWNMRECHCFCNEACTHEEHQHRHS